jgi:acyl carrier protein
MITHPADTSILDRVADAVRDVFGCPDLDITRETTALDVDGWDSLTHTILLLRLESDFEIRLPFDRVATAANVGELADVIQSLAPASPGTAKDVDTRYVIMHGNCQFGFVLAMLADEMRLCGYEVVCCANFTHPTMKNAPEPEQLARCDVFIEQVSNWHPTIAPDYAVNLPPGCRRLRVPALMFHSLWPFHQTDPRDVHNEEFPFGKHPYGDSYVIRLMREHTDPDVIVQRYMELDIKKLIDLDRLHETVVQRWEANDKMADLPMGPAIEQHFRKLRLFDTFNHPAHTVIEMLRDAFAAFILDGKDCVLPPAFLQHPCVQIPIHPQVIEHFKLEWVGPDSTYQFRDDRRRITFAQWLRAYVTWSY